MQKKEVPVVAIDGPSGSGKGTLAQIVANRLGFALLDSGALYRLAALATIAHHVDPSDEHRVAEVASEMNIRFDSVADKGVIAWLDNRDVTMELRNEKTAEVASQIAAQTELRQTLLQVQRDFRRPPGLVADGRDMGTVVFPDADIKIFLTASTEVRARRRLHQLKEKGIDANLGSLLEEISKRDARDSGRQIAPLKPAEGAVILDSSELSIEEVCRQVLELIDRNLVKGALH